MPDPKTTGALEIIWRQIRCYTCGPLVPFSGHPIAYYWESTVAAMALWSEPVWLHSKVRLTWTTV